MKNVLIVNFSHPVTVDQGNQVKAKVEGDTVEVMTVGVHLDLDGDIVEQVRTIAAQATDEVERYVLKGTGETEVYIILPGYSLAAVILDRLIGFEADGYLLLSRDKNAVSPVYKVAGIIKLQRHRFTEWPLSLMG